MPKKCILVLLDGLGDRAYARFNHKTPLQAADTPVLDKLSESGANGLYHAATVGQALPSENAHFLMFGYDMENFPGRGVLEATGYGIDISRKDVALLSHFVNLVEKNNMLILKKGKPEATSKEITGLIESIRQFKMNGITISFHPTGGIRGILKMSGDVSPYITDSDPFIDGRQLVKVTPWQTEKNDPAAQNTAHVLTAYLSWAYQNLIRHPVNTARKKAGNETLNGLTTQRPGRLKTVQPFYEKYGLRGMIMASGAVYWGLGRYIGMEVEKVKDNSDPGADLEKRIHLARKKLSDVDFVHVHTKAPDEAAHTKSPEKKKRAIELLDAGIGRAIQPIMDDPEILLIITADHSTPSSGTLVHSGETVPLMINGKGVRRDSVKYFNEVSAASGCLGQVRGKELIYQILNYLDRAKLHGIMDSPIDQPFWPGHYEPFQRMNLSGTEYES